MGFWRQLGHEAYLAGTAYLLAALVISVVTIGLVARHERKRARGMILLTVLHLTLLPVVAFLEWQGMHQGARGTRLAAYLFEMLAAVGIAGTLVFALLL